ncbi:MAG: oligosaccharide repeat unit polymerase [Methylotenera sp.]
MNIFRTLLDTRWSAPILMAGLFFMYVVMSLVVNFFSPSPYLVELAMLSFVSCFFLGIGFYLPLFDYRFRINAKRMAIKSNTLHSAVWIFFIVFILITFATAQSIPIISVFQGAGADELSQQRGDFLKGRVGMESALLYISTIFVGALLPYSLINLFIEKSRLRYYLMMIFFVYTISTLQKALFLSVVFPLIYLVSRKVKFGYLRILSIVIISLIIIFVVTILASGGQSDFNMPQQELDIGVYFSSSYAPSGAFDMLVWRSISVPLFTAADTLLVFHESFGGQQLLGATSNLLSTLFSMERIPLEKLVFEYEWTWNDIANANAVFITDAYVNFGWVGVILFSTFVGQSLRWFYKSKDEAFKSLWLLYCFGLFSASLIGMMFSNGYLLIFLIAFFVKLKTKYSVSEVIYSGQLKS